jgi:hypothetical protein
MAQILTVCRHGGEWAVRDATGEYYGQSPVIDETIETAHRLSRRNGSSVVMSAEAAAYIQTNNGELAGSLVNSQRSGEKNGLRSRFRLGPRIFR